MNRRALLGLLGGAAAWPLAARAQQGERVRRIGVLMSLAADDSESPPRVAALQQGLRHLGWTENQNLKIEYRWTGGDASLAAAFAKELVNLGPEVILGVTTPVIMAILRETRSIPVIFVQVIDPVRSGLVAGLARPGANVTGFTNFEYSMGPKWIGFLREIEPELRRVAILFNPSTAQYASGFMAEMERNAPSLGVAPIGMPAVDLDAMASAIGRLAGEPGVGLLVLPDIFMSLHRERVVELAASHRLPAIYPFRYFAESGGLIAYGVDSVDLFRRAATYVDRVLKGTKVGDLPVQLPTKFELVINLKTAKSFGWKVPLQLQQLADEVIE